MTDFIATLLLTGVLLRLSIIDSKTLRLPDIWTLPLIATGLTHAALTGEPSIVASLIGGCAGFALFWAIGASIGPLLSAMLVDWQGPAAFFTFVGAMHGAFVVYTVMRIIMGAPDDPDRGRFAGLLRTSPVFARMAAQSVNRDTQPDEKEVPEGEDKPENSR